MTTPSAEDVLAVACKLWGKPSARRGDEARFGAKGSKSVNLADLTWFDHEAGAGGGWIDLFRLAKEPLPNDIIADLTAYDYHDADGRVLFQVVRLPPGSKQRFYQRRPDGNGGWIKNLKGVTPVLYRLTDLAAADRSDPVYIAEGEKDVENLRRLGLLATTNPGGAEKWKPQYSEALRGRKCILLPDNDAAGRRHMTQVAKALAGIAAAVITVPLPGLGEKGDVSDWLAQGHGAEQLAALWLEAPQAQPADEPKHRFTIVIWEDDMSRPETDGVVERLFYAGDISMNFGETGSAKSFLAIDLSAHIALGWPWFGRKVKQGAVIYIAAEGAAHIDRRIVAFKQYHAGRLAEIREPVPFGLIRSDLNLLDPEADLPELIQQINAKAATFSVPLLMILIDTMSAALAGGDENRPDVMGTFLANVKRLQRETGGPHIHLLHHPGKDPSKGDRGHYITRAAVETRIETTKPATEMTGSFRVLKQRDGAAGDTFGFGLEVIEVAYTEDGDPITSCVVVPVEGVSKPVEKPKLKVEYQAALGFLWDVVAEVGQPLDKPGYPNLKAVTVDQWRDRLKQRGLYDGDGPSRNWLARCKQALIGARLITIDERLVWPVPRR